MGKIDITDPLYYKIKIKNLIEKARANGLDVRYGQEYLLQCLIIEDKNPTTTTCKVYLE